MDSNISEFKTRKKVNPIYFIVGVALLLVVFGIIIFKNAPDYKYNKYLKKAKQAFEQEDYEKVAALYEQAFDIHVNQEDLKKLVYTYDAKLSEMMKAGAYDTKMQKKINAIFESKEDIWDSLWADLDYDELEKLLEDCVWIISKDKTMYFFYIGQADQKYAESQYEQALQQYEEILSWTADKSEAYIEELKARAATGIENSELALAKQLIADQQYDKAVKKYDRILDMNPGRAEAYIGKSNVYLLQGDIIAALDVLKGGEKKCEGTEVSERKDYIIANTIVATKLEYRQPEGKERYRFPKQEWEYNEKGQLVKEISYNDTDGGWINYTITYTYNDAGIITLERVENGDGAYSEYIYDENGWLIEKQEHGWTIEKYTYDEHGWLIEEQNKRNGFTGKYTYDEHGWLIEEQNVWGTDINRKNTYTYDADGVLLEVHSYSDVDGVMTEDGYVVADSAHRVLKSSVGWEYGYRYSEMNNASSSEYFESDDVLSVIGVYLTYKGNRIKEYEYNEKGRISKIVYSGEEGVVGTVDFEYYDSGVLACYKVNDMVSGDITVQTYTEAGAPVDSTGKYEYNDKGEIVRDEKGNTYGYDENHRLIYYCHTSPRTGYYRYLSPSEYRDIWGAEQLTGYQVCEYMYDYDEQGRLVSVRINDMKEYVDYYDSGSSSYLGDDGVLYTCVEGHYYKPKYYFKTPSGEYSWSYVKCDLDDPERISSVRDLANSYEIWNVINKLKIDPYCYTYKGNCKLQTSSSNSSSESVKETYNELGYVETSQTSGNIIKHIYEYTYMFIGVIE